MEAALLVVLGAAVTLLAGLVTAAISRSHEHERWLRDERKAAYIAVLTATSDVWMGPLRPPDKARDFEALQNVANAMAAVELLAPDGVSTAADEVSTAAMVLVQGDASTFAAFSKAREAFLKLVRADLATSK